MEKRGRRVYDIVEGSDPRMFENAQLASKILNGFLDDVKDENGILIGYTVVCGYGSTEKGTAVFSLNFYPKSDYVGQKTSCVIYQAGGNGNKVILESNKLSCSAAEDAFFIYAGDKSTFRLLLIKSNGQMQYNETPISVLKNHL